MITVLGIGPGRPDLMLAGTRDVLQAADIVVGSARQLATLAIPAAQQYQLPKLSELKTYLLAHPDLNVVLLASGDPLLYGIGNWALSQLPTGTVKIVPGISAIQYCFHQVGLSMNDSYLTSSHGRVPDWDFLLQHEKVGMVTDATIGPVAIAAAIRERGQHRRLWVGENLSYPDEKISEFIETTVEERTYGLNVVIITNA